MAEKSNPVLENVRRALGRAPGAGLPERPAVLPPRLAGSPADEMDRLLQEIRALSGVTAQISAVEIGAHLQALVHQEKVAKAALWSTPFLQELRIVDVLESLGVEIVPPSAGKQALAGCDLGITEVDFALPETGTLGLLSSAEKPRAVSLLPRVHLALVRPQALRADLHPMLAEARQHPYLILITGPSRTADIELTVTLGVHGPKALYVWALPE